MADYNSSYTGAEIDEGVGNGLAAPTTYAPIDHAASASTYGAGTGTKYGHLMLSDSTSSTSSTSGGVAATPAAVKAAYDLANGKQSALTFDNTPTADSANPVKSGGVYSALADKADQSELNTFVRPNLLDNWYFVGGGSQQGGGQFPINTQGQTSYTQTSSPNIDKWMTVGGSLAISLTANGLTLQNNSTAVRIGQVQYFDNPDRVRGLTLTGSILLTDGSLYWGTVTVPSQVPSTEQLLVFSDFDGNTWRITVATDGRIFAPIMVAASSTVSVAAVKVELGDTQTLAHQENGVWVLNEIPDYNEQMLRCNEGLGQFAQVEYGSYTGTGTYGSGNANSLTFPFVPKFLLVKQEASSAYSIAAANGLTSVYSDYSTTYSNTMTWSDKMVTWYSTSAQRQLNTSATVYHYVAVG